MTIALANTDGDPLPEDRVLTLIRLCNIAGGFFDAPAQIAEVWAQRADSETREYLRGQVELICEASGLPLDPGVGDVVRYLSEPLWLNEQVSLWVLDHAMRSDPVGAVIDELAKRRNS